MESSLKPLVEAIANRSLPEDFAEIFSSFYDRNTNVFNMQENVILDFKEEIPRKFSADYGFGFVRLALGFHNSFGGVIVIGVKDENFSIVGTSEEFDIEAFNRVLSDYTFTNIECKSKRYAIGQPGLFITVVLVPKRIGGGPIRLAIEAGKYKAGTLWLRERHEVIIAKANSLSFLYGARDIEEYERAIGFPVHRSLPPSPATIDKFISRDALITPLWEWLALGTQPRVYLHGPGGSGKSTLAFEFARSVADSQQLIVGREGEKIDYVLFISAKETELNTHVGRINAYALQQFRSRDEQYNQMLFHSGMISAIEDETFKNVDSLLNELFDNFCGLIVLDDIDTLSRNGKDTGEEDLFIKIMRAKRRNRILYTLRFPPSHALNSSLAVSGLDYEGEFFEFINECCHQFNVPHPSAEHIVSISEESSRLPLLIETIIGLRKHCSNYSEALKIYKDKGGDEARRYLYQREYDRLLSYGKARQILAALYLVQEPITFSALSGLFPFSREQIADAIAEPRSVFLSYSDGEDGETYFQLTPPAVPFIRTASNGLVYFDQLKATVQHFRSENVRVSKDEASLIVRLERLIRQRRFGEMISACAEYPDESPIIVNPKIKALLAQAYSESGPEHREKARDAFKQSLALGFSDAFMMRRWYNMEFGSGYGLQEAEEVCRSVVNNPKMTARAKSEFWSKLGACFFQRGQTVISVNRDKAFSHFRESTTYYLEGLRLSKTVRELDWSNNISWVERPLERIVANCKGEFDHFFLLIEGLTERDHDVDLDGARVIAKYIAQLPNPTTAVAQKSLRGICTRVLNKLSKFSRIPEKYPGFSLLSVQLETIRGHFSKPFDN